MLFLEDFFSLYNLIGSKEKGNEKIMRIENFDQPDFTNGRKSSIDIFDYEEDELRYRSRLNEKDILARYSANVKFSLISI